MRMDGSDAFVHCRTSAVRATTSCCSSSNLDCNNCAQHRRRLQAACVHRGPVTAAWACLYVKFSCRRVQMGGCRGVSYRDGLVRRGFIPHLAGPPGLAALSRRAAASWLLSPSPAHSDTWSVMLQLITRRPRISLYPSSPAQGTKACNDISKACGLHRCMHRCIWRETLLTSAMFRSSAAFSSVCAFVFSCSRNARLASISSVDTDNELCTRQLG